MFFFLFVKNYGAVTWKPKLHAVFFSSTSITVYYQNFSYNLQLRVNLYLYAKPESHTTQMESTQPESNSNGIWPTLIPFLPFSICFPLMDSE